MNEPKLLPCPFCGGPGTFQDCRPRDPDIDLSYEWWMAGCDHCGVWSPFITEDKPEWEQVDPTKEIAAAAWNTRAASQKASHNVL